MSEHEPLPVSGYTTQSDVTVKLVNANKKTEELVLQALDFLGTVGGVDKRWLAIGRTNIEQGFMAINRSIFCPQRVTLND